MKRWSALRWAALLSALFSQSAVAATPPKVVTLAPHLTEMVCAIGGCSLLQAVGAYSNYPPEVTQLPVVSDALSINLERLLQLAPTHIYAWDGGTPESQLARLRSLGLPVKAMRVNQLQDVAMAMRGMGEDLGLKASAEAAAQHYEQGLAALRKRYRAAKPVRVFYQIEANPAYTVNAKSPISEAIRLCGGVNVFGELKSLAAPVSIEAVIAAKPDLVLYASVNGDAVRRYWAPFTSLAWVRKNQFYAVEADLIARASPRLLKGAEAVCAALDRARGRWEVGGRT